MAHLRSAVTRETAAPNSHIWLRNARHDIVEVYVYPGEWERNPNCLVGCTYCFWVGHPNHYLRHCSAKHERSFQLWQDWRQGIRRLEALATIFEANPLEYP